MINGAHIVLYTNDPEADRTFFRDVLNLSSVDAGHGWLIFALPPAEAAFHDFEQKDSEQKASSVARAPSPAFSERTDAQQEKSDPAPRHELFLMCDDIAATLRDLKSKYVPVSTVSEQRWGNLATLTLPGGGRLGIYEPKHPRPPEV